MGVGIHKIKTHCFEIELENEELAHQLNDYFSDLVKNKIIQGVEKVFDEVCPEHVTIKIPHIEIDLGQVDVHQIGSELEYRLRQELKKHLSLVVETLEFNPNHPDYEVITNQESHANLLLTFLQTGTFPWWAPDKLFERNYNFSVYKLFEEIDQADNQEVVAVLKKVINSQVMLERLITNLKSEELVSLIKMIAVGHVEDISPIYKEISTISNAQFFKEVSPNWTLQTFWKEVLKVFLHNTSFTSTATSSLIYTHIVKAIAQQEHAAHLTILEQLMLMVNQSQVDEHKVPLLVKYLQSKPVAEQLRKSSISEVLKVTKKHNISDLKEKVSTKDSVKTILVAGEVLSMDEMKSRWFAPTEKVKWLPKLQKSDLLAIISLSWPAEREIIEKIYEEVRQVIVTKYWKKISSTQFISLYTEVVLDQLFIDRMPGFQSIKIVSKVIQIIAERLLIPKLLVIESFISPTQFEVLPEIAGEIRKNEISESDSAYKNPLAEATFEEKYEASSVLNSANGLAFVKELVRNFFLFGFYPEAFVNAVKITQSDESVEVPGKELSNQDKLGELIIKFLQKSPTALGGMIEQFTPRQMLRLVTRLKNELPEPYSQQLIEAITKIRMVAPMPEVRSAITNIKLEEVIKNYEDAVFIISNWHQIDEVRNHVTFHLEELLESFLIKYPRKSIVYFENISAFDLSRIFDEVNDATAERITSMIDRNEIADDEGLSVGKEESYKKEEVKGFSTAEPLYIKNAGLVILYPFLSRYFNMLKLLSEDKKAFESKHAVQRAVRLLHFLVFGRKEGKEYEMTLNKIICGMPFEIPLENNIELTDKEIEISESLLNGVIQNWEILKKSSIDNLRGSFLFREGRLEETEKAWILKVEQKGFDVLVDKIPWSFNLIKFLWMKKPIHVDWR